MSMTNLWLFGWLLLAIYSFLNLMVGYIDRNHSGLSIAIHATLLDLGICGIVNCFWVFP